MIQAIQIFVGLYFVYIVALKPHLILPATLYAAVFDASAVINVGSVSILPFFFVLLLLPARCLFERIDKDNFFGRTTNVRRIVGVVACFALIVDIGCLTLPRIFTGFPIKNPAMISSLFPLSPTMSNFAQGTYLFLLGVFIWWIAQRAWTTEDVRRIIRAYHGSGIVVIILGYYQIACFYTGLPYPADLLHTGHFTILLNDFVSGMPRVSSTFTETSALSPFLLGYLAFAFEELIAAQFRSMKTAIIVLAALALLILSTSSTAYLGLAALFGLAVVRHAIFASSGMGVRLKITGGVLAFLAVVIVAIWASPTLQDVVQQSVFEKKDSSSYEERHGADLHSYDLALRTYGFGVGLGSTWTSSFCAALMGSTGVPGTVAFAGILYALFRGCTLKARWFRDERLAVGTGLVVMLMTLFISCPNLASPILWAVIGALTALIAATENKLSLERIVSTEREYFHSAYATAGAVSTGVRFASLTRGAT